MSDDKEALISLLSVSVPGVPHSVSHYLYFTTEQSAAQAALRLKGLGFATEERVGADGVNWLVLAKQMMIPTEDRVTSVRQLMEEVAVRLGGEYDGWEAAVIPPNH